MENQRVDGLRYAIYRFTIYVREVGRLEQGFLDWALYCGPAVWVCIVMYNIILYIAFALNIALAVADQNFCDKKSCMFGCLKI